jgi:hypothetical protein
MQSIGETIESQTDSPFTVLSTQALSKAPHGAVEDSALKASLAACLS